MTNRKLNRIRKMTYKDWGFFRSKGAAAAARELNETICTSVTNKLSFNQTWRAAFQVLQKYAETTEIGALDTMVRDILYVQLLYVYGKPIPKLED